MFFSDENKDERGTILLGCLIAAVIAALAITCVASFNLGWFTPAALTMLWQSFVGALAFFFLLAIVGCSAFFEGIVMIPLVIIASVLAGSDEEREGAYW